MIRGIFKRSGTLLLFILLAVSCVPAFAQDEVTDENDYQDTYEESELYIDENSRPRQSSSEQKQGAGGGIGSLGITPDDKKDNGESISGPDIPCEPDTLPIDGGIIYLAAAGLGYGGYNLHRKRRKK